LKTLFIRSISGIVYAVLVIGSILAGAYYFAGITLLFLIFGLYEYWKLRDFSKSWHLAYIYVSNLAIFLYSVFSLFGIIAGSWWYLGAGILVLTLLFLISTQRKTNRWKQTLDYLLGVFYITISLVLLNLLYQIPVENNYQVLIGLFFLIWLNDTFAYFTGSLIGKHKMSKISPKKTWEGAIGGFIFSMAGAYVFSIIFHDLSLTEWIIFAFITVVFGTLGDLFESKLKRQAGLKESGNLMPGHGGILDRIDSILIAAPIVFFYIFFLID